jgi:hypothetical protein
MKNMFNKVKNNMEYAKWRKIRVESEKMMQQHINDEDQTEFKFWCAQYSLALKKCREIEI